MPSYRLILAYDGADFRGSQIQPGQRTVQGEVTRALPGRSSENRRVTLAGRTDSGVHALGQVASVCLPGWRDSAPALSRVLAARLPRDLAATDVQLCDDSFHPRYDAIWREYRYWISKGAPDPRLRRYSWDPLSPVSVARVAAGCAQIVGIHDFATFASGGEGVPWSERVGRPRGTIRTVFKCECRETHVHSSAGSGQECNILEIRIVADGYLPRMVRNITGALVEVGRSRREPDWISELLGARDRRAGPAAAPAHGLTLWKIGFGDELMDSW